MRPKVVAFAALEFLVDASRVRDARKRRFIAHEAKDGPSELVPDGLLVVLVDVRQKIPGGLGIEGVEKRVGGVLCEARSMNIPGRGRPVFRFHLHLALSGCPRHQDLHALSGTFARDLASHEAAGVATLVHQPHAHAEIPRLADRIADPFKPGRGKIFQTGQTVIGPEHNGPDASGMHFDQVAADVGLAHVPFPEPPHGDAVFGRRILEVLSHLGRRGDQDLLPGAVGSVSRGCQPNEQDHAVRTSDISFHRQNPHAPGSWARVHAPVRAPEPLR